MNLHRKVIGLAVLLAGWLEIISAGGRPGLGWLLLVLLAWICARSLTHALERPSTRIAQWLWLVPAGFGVSLCLYDQEVVAACGPALLLFSTAVCLMFTLQPPQSLDELAALFRPLATRWFGGCRRLPEAGRSAGLGSTKANYPSLLKGCMLGLPLLLIFGALFCAADPEFRDWLQSLSAFLTVEGLLPPLRWALYALACMALFLGLGLSSREPRGEESAAGGEDDVSHWAVPLTLLNLLFGAFLAKQAPRLFLATMPPARLANYAREGFFELLVCTILVYCLVRFIYTYCLLGRYRPGLRLLTCALVGQAIGVGASALHRLWLYSAEFGMSVLRIYALLGVLAFSLLLLILLGACLLEPGRSRLQAILNMAGAVVLLATSWVNVDGWVSSSHVDRALAHGRVLDIVYLQKLSNDAVPALVRGAHSDNPKVRADCLTILEKMRRPAAAPWYCTNWSRKRASELSTFR